MKKDELTYTQSIYGVLAILSIGPQSGYDIRKVLDHPEMFYWSESYGNIYPMLRALQKDGLVDKKDSYIKKKKRVIYQINQKGLDELHTWILEPVNLVRFRVELLMKLQFGISCGVENMISQIAHYRKLTEEQINTAEHMLGKINLSEESLARDLRKIAMSFFSEWKKSTVSWCDESVEILKKWKQREAMGSSAISEDMYPSWLSPELPSLEPAVVSLPPRVIPMME